MFAFLKLWLTRTVYETSGHIILQSNEDDIPAACFGTRPDPPGWRGDGGWTGERKGRREEARQGGEVRPGTKEKGKEGGTEAWRRKEERFDPSLLC